MRMQRHTTHGHVRSILLILAATALAVAVLVLAGDRLITDDQRARAQTAERPNFVFVLTDDLDERAMEDLPGITDVPTSRSPCAALLGQPSCGVSMPTTTAYSTTSRLTVANKSSETWAGIGPPSPPG